MGQLNDLRVLVVEDEVLIGLDVADLLSELGCLVAGPFRTVAEASNSINEQRPAAAVLDVNLGSETAIPIADALAAKGVPFVWLTGYPRSILPERHCDRPFVAKPFSTATLLDALASLSGRTQLTHEAA